MNAELCFEKYMFPKCIFPKKQKKNIWGHNVDDTHF